MTAFDQTNIWNISKEMLNLRVKMSSEKIMSQQNIKFFKFQLSKFFSIVF